MKFQPFNMASYSLNWPIAGATAMHSSNPEPFTWDELQQLTQLDLKQSLLQAPLNYESNQGSITVREALSEKLYKQCQPHHIALTSGAQEGIYVLTNSLLEAGDEVVTFTPCFEPLVTVARSLGAKVKTVALDAKDNWSIPWPKFEQAITTKTKLVIINFPHNPTGTSISNSDLQHIINLCDQYGCWLFSDEVFRGLEHEGSPLPAVADCYDKGVSMGVMSKSMALPGVRLGWLVTQNPRLLQNWLSIKAYLSICQSSLDAQLTAQLIPHSEKLLKRNRDIIMTNKASVYGMTNNNPEFHLSESKGAGTVFVELKSFKSAENFCIEVLKKHRIFIIPSAAFVTDFSGFRLTLGQRNALKFYQSIFTANH